MKTNFKELVKKVVETARSFEGITEIKGNKGWISKVRPKVAKWFQAKMESHGWKMGYAWCAYFCELVWSEVYDNIGEYRKLFDKHFSGSATKTFKQFKNAGWEVGKTPEIGAICIWEHVKSGKASWKGHAAIVVGFDDKYIHTIDGNTNAAGSREGETVAFKKRKYNYRVQNGLQLVGFIYAPGTKGAIPFNSKKEGDLFREYVNNYYPEYASKIQLDRSGLFYNSYIRKAFEKYGKEYTELLKK